MCGRPGDRALRPELKGQFHLSRPGSPPLPPAGARAGTARTPPRSAARAELPGRRIGLAASPRTTRRNASSSASYAGANRSRNPGQGLAGAAGPCGSTDVSGVRSSRPTAIWPSSPASSIRTSYPAPLHRVAVAVASVASSRVSRAAAVSTSPAARNIAGPASDPVAYTSTTSRPVTHRRMSKSWTRQSRNRPPECGRYAAGGGAGSEVTARTVCSLPSAPPRTAVRAAAYPASNRRMKPSWSTLPARSTSRSALSVPAGSSAIGFSQNAGSPARAAVPISSACADVAEAITTASTPARSTSATDPAAAAPVRAATAAALAPSVSVTTSASTAGWRASTPAWKEPIRPVPMSPIRMDPTCRPPAALSTICPDKRERVRRLGPQGQGSRALSLTDRRSAPDPPAAWSCQVN